VERLVVTADGDTIRAEHLPNELRGGGEAVNPSIGSTYQDLKTDAERRIILAALEKNEWQITRTAESLGLADHASLLKIMRRLGIRR
jgi:transcriptional regulator of acetoin/glycerol metabolism